MSVQTPKGAAGQAPAAPTTTAPAGGAQPANGTQFAQGKQPAAVKYYKMIIENYPNSAYRSTAEETCWRIAFTARFALAI